MAENLAETIKRIRELSAALKPTDMLDFTNGNHPIDEFVEQSDPTIVAYLGELHNNADALLDAAEYGEKAREFFREHSERAKLLLIENCNKCEMVCPMEVATCEHVIAAAEAYGLWPEGE